MDAPASPVLFTPFHKRWCTDQLKKILLSPYSLYFRDHPKLSVGPFDEYCQVIKNPVWFRGILERLRLGSYCYVDEWITDVRCVWENAFTWNLPKTEGYECAMILKEMFEKKCLPVPNSEADELRIQRQKLVEKIKNHINSATPAVRALHWDMCRIVDVPLEDFDPIEWVREADMEIDKAWKDQIIRA
jgi:hypothetical protein